MLIHTGCLNVTKVGLCLPPFSTYILLVSEFVYLSIYQPINHPHFKLNEHNLPLQNTNTFPLEFLGFLFAFLVQKHIQTKHPFCINYDFTLCKLRPIHIQ